MEKSNNRRNRSVLKSYFQKGDVPTEQQFAELIDSVSNIVEDGQVTRTPSGWAFFPGQAGHLDIGLYTEEPLTEVDIPAWTLAVTPEKKLTVRNANGEAVMEALQDKSIVLYGSLKVEDEITATAYRTTGGGGITPSGEGYLTVPADKQWHDLPIDVSREGFGCRVYSVYASFREQGTGLCQLTRATALWLNFMQQRIESPQKHWWGWTGSVRFRWQMREKNIYLQIRTKKQLPSGEIHCRVVEMYKG